MDVCPSSVARELNMWTSIDRSSAIPAVFSFCADAAAWILSMKRSHIPAQSIKVTNRGSLKTCLKSLACSLTFPSLWTAALTQMSFMLDPARSARAKTACMIHFCCHLQVLGVLLCMASTKTYVCRQHAPCKCIAHYVKMATSLIVL